MKNFYLVVILVYLAISTLIETSQTSAASPVQNTKSYYSLCSNQLYSNYTISLNQKNKGTTSATITVSVSSLDFEKVYSGYYSVPQSYTVTGTNLTADITVTAPNGIEVASACDGTYGQSLTLTESGGNVNTSVYVRYKGGDVSGNITNSSTGATTQNVTISETASATNLPSTYYSTATGSGATLKTNLKNIIEGHTVESYTDLWTDFQNTDKKPNGKVWDMYSQTDNCTTVAYEYTFSTNQCGTYSAEGDCYNREHSMPKSWFGVSSGSENSYDAATDLHHIVPTDGYVNNRRGNLALGTVSSPTYTSSNGSMTGPNSYSGATGNAFEPVDEYKGDFARMYFYMATRYEDDWVSRFGSSSDGNNMIDASSSYPCFKSWAISMLLQWNSDDPVSQKEMTRNDAIYTIQGNRNPFIDNPSYADAIWASDPTLIVSTTSISNYSYEVGSGPSSSQNFNLSGTNLDGTEVTITAPTNYEVSTDNSTFGTSKTISYTAPTLNSTTIYVRLKSGLSTGTYNSENVTCSDNGTASNVTVSNNGEVTAPPDPEPTNQPTNFSATANGSSQIDLSWTDALTGSQAPAGYLILANTTGTFTSPSDGTDPTVDTDLSDGSATVKVAHGSSANYSFTGLSASTKYYFTIYSYTNSGTDIDYKITSAPTDNATTNAGSSICGTETFTNIPTSSSSSYSSRSWTGDDGSTWNATNARTDQTINGKAICFKTTSGSYVESGTISGGCGELTFKHQQKFSGSGGKITSVLVNSTEYLTSDISVTTTEQTATISNINVSGDFVIKIITNGGSRIAIDDISWTCYGGASSNADSKVEVGASVEPASISSTIDTEGEKIQAFDFKFTDLGTSDGLATIIDQIKITQGNSNNVADWTNAIAGAYLSGSDLATDLAGTINPSNITFASDNMISIADNDNETYSLKLYLKTDLSGTSDNSILEFALDYNNITTDASGSSFGSGIIESGDSNCTIDIEATELQFVQQPTETMRTISMSPQPSIKACDVNGNIDEDYSANITITSTGNMTNDPITEPLSNGIAQFDIKHEDIGTGLKLTASSSTSIANIESNSFNITTLRCSDLMISEYMEGTSERKGIELFNGTGSTVDLSNYELQKDNSGNGSWDNTLSLSGSIANSKTYVIVYKNNDGASTTDLTDDGINYDLATNNSTMSFSGDDPIGLFKNQAKSFVLIDIVPGPGNTYSDKNLKRNRDIYSPSSTFNSSEWAVVDPASSSTLGSVENPLPVIWNNISAKPLDNGIIINWSTTTETNNDHFEIEHSIDNNTFSYIGEITGSENATELSHYNFLHKNPGLGINYYRIKQVDFNGEFDYSQIISAKWSNITINNLNINYIYCSPSTQQALIHNNLNTYMKITIFNITGEIIYTKTINNSSINYLLDFSDAHLHKGMYFIKVKSGIHETRKKFIVY